MVIFVDISYVLNNLIRDYYHCLKYRLYTIIAEGYLTIGSAN